MRIVVQRVNSASVSTSGKVVGEISKGLFVLVGFKKGDSEGDVSLLSEKLTKLRVMPDANNKMNLALGETTGQVLVVSQFTLYANTKGGNRPSFVEALDPGHARVLYDLFINKLKDAGLATQTGSFGEYMQIRSDLDGPVTIILES